MARKQSPLPSLPEELKQFVRNFKFSHQQINLLKLVLMNSSQKAMIAATKSNHPTHRSISNVRYKYKTHDELANEYFISTKQIQRAKLVIDQGSEFIQHKVISGELSLHRAEKIIKESRKVRTNAHPSRQ